MLHRGQRLDGDINNKNEVFMINYNRKFLTDFTDDTCSGKYSGKYFNIQNPFFMYLMNSTNYV